jgi:hypothetical protein
LSLAGRIFPAPHGCAVQRAVSRVDVQTAGVATRGTRVNPIICQNCLTPQPEKPASVPRPTNCFNCRQPLQTAQTGPTGRPLLEMHDYSHETEAAALHQQASKAAGAMLLVALVQFLAGAIFYFVPDRRFVDSQQSFVTGFVLGIGVLYLLFYFWALAQPLPAAFTGLTIYLLMLVADTIYDPSSLWRGIVVKIVVVLMLWRAIAAAMRYRSIIAANPSLA